MIKLFIFLKRKSGLSHEEFASHWQEVHAGRVLSELAGSARRYVQNDPIRDADVPGLVFSDLDGADELWFDSLEDLTSAIADPGFRDVDSSTALFADPGRTIRLAAEEAIKFDRGFGRVKFMGLSRRHPSMSHDEWIRYWIDVHGPMAHGVPEFTRYYGRYVHNYVLPVSVDPSGQTPEFDGVVEEWVESVAEMANCLSEPGYLEVVAPDEQKFVDFSRSHMLLVEERVILEAGT